MRSLRLRDSAPVANISITVLALLALLLLPLALGMAQPAHTGALHDHHAQHTSESPAPNHACEHFHICCACLVLVPTATQLFAVVAVFAVEVQFQSLPQDTPKPPPRT